MDRIKESLENLAKLRFDLIVFFFALAGLAVMLIREFLHLPWGFYATYIPLAVLGIVILFFGVVGIVMRVVYRNKMCWWLIILGMLLGAFFVFWYFDAMYAELTAQVAGV